MKPLEARMPKGFTHFCRFVYYFDILFLIFMAWQGGRAMIIKQLPFYLIVGFSLWFYAHWIRLANRKIPTYEITDEGILDRASYTEKGLLVPWAEIEDAKHLNYLGFHGTKVILKNKKAFMERQHGFTRFMAYLNLWCYGTPLALWNFCSDIPGKEIEGTIRERLTAATLPLWDNSESQQTGITQDAVSAALHESPRSYDYQTTTEKSEVASLRRN
jgi:hypothetical protein